MASMFVKKENTLHLDKVNHQVLRWKVRIYAGEKTQLKK